MDGFRYKPGHIIEERPQLLAAPSSQRMSGSLTSPIWQTDPRIERVLLMSSINTTVLGGVSHVSRQTQLENCPKMGNRWKWHHFQPPKTCSANLPFSDASHRRRLRPSERGAWQDLDRGSL